MKLLKKLLPIASVAGVAAVVTPLVTSCGSGMIKFDGKSIYIPNIAPAKPDEKIVKKGGYTNDEGLRLYFDDLDSNPEIFAQDMYYSVSYLLSIGSSLYPFISGPEINGELKYSNIVVNHKDYKLSYDLHFKLNINLSSPTYYVLPIIYANNLDLIAHVKNLPYSCLGIIEEDGETEWDVCPWAIYNWQVWDDNTSIGFHLNGSVIYDGRHGEYVHNFKDKDIFIDKKFDPLGIEEFEANIAIELFSDMLGHTLPSSYHLSLIPCLPI